MLTHLEGYDIEHPWTRQPCDDERAWRAFVVFRDGLQPRSLLDVVKATGDPLRVAKQWHDDNAWELRVVAFDQYLDNARTKQVAMVTGEDARLRAARHLHLLQDVQDVVAATLADWKRRVAYGEVVIDNPREVVRAIKEMVTLERLIAGEVTERTESHTKSDLTRLSVDELEALKRLQEKAGA